MEDVKKISLQALLATFADRQGYNNDVDLVEITTDGANFTSRLFRIKITTPEKPDLKLFAKVCIISEDIRKKKAYDRLFRLELYFYRKLVEVFAKLENDHYVPQEHRFVVPKCYLCDETYLEEVVVLEDLVDKGYTLYDRFKSVDWEHAAPSIKELAKLHALSFAYAQEYPEDFKQSSKELVCDLTSGNDEEKHEHDSIVTNAIKVVNDVNKERLAKYVKDNVIIRKMLAYHDPVIHPVLTHGDFRSSNLMYKKNEDGEMEAVVVDYQTLHTGCAVKDLIYFIFTSTDEEFRGRYYQKLIEYYYEQLCQALQIFHLDPQKVYPRKDFDYELKEMLPFGLHIVMFVLPMVTVDATNAPNYSVEASELNFKSNKIFAERFNEVVNDYVKWGII